MPQNYETDSSLLLKEPKEQSASPKRADERIQTKVAALLVGKKNDRGIETGQTENISRNGARVITGTQWQHGDALVLSLPGFRFTCAARVAYSDLLGDGRFGTGLEFTGPNEDPEIAALITTLNFPQR